MARLERRAAARTRKLYTRDPATQSQKKSPKALADMQGNPYQNPRWPSTQRCRSPHRLPLCSAEASRHCDDFELFEDLLPGLEESFDALARAKRDGFSGGGAPFGAGTIVGG